MKLWLEWALGYVSRAWTAVWSKVKTVLSATWDPKPRTILVWLCCWLAICVSAIVVWSLGTSWVNKKLATIFGLSSEVSTLLSKPDASKPSVIAKFPKLPDVITTVPPKVEAKPNAPANAEKASKAPAKAKRKKPKAIVSSDPWKF